MMAFSSSVLVAWLIVSHRLWERPSSGWERRRLRVFNASTVATLLIGIACGYVCLGVINVVAEVFVIDPGFLEKTVGHPVGVWEYVAIAWFTTSVSLLAGAVGSGFEDETSVRTAAYSQRERQRRREDERDR